MTPASDLPCHEVYALRYGTVERRERDNFLSPQAADAHDGPMPLDFFVWLIQSQGQCILVDTGFSAPAAARRQRSFLCPPDQALAHFGVSASNVRDVVITHMHYDHAGNLPAFPNARIHLQDREMQFATGRCMCHPTFRHFLEVDDVKAMVDKVFADRVVFHEGDEEIAPGVWVHHIGGHTLGLQVVRVHTARGWVVLASDAAHFYRNLTLRNPFPAIVDLMQMLEGYDKITRLADSEHHIVPGHDPLVRQRYRRLPIDAVDVFALHEPPRMEV
jgi:glyoxylase-like metal-dependent hydrolase (beta-lactamase superfamily II)